MRTYGIMAALADGSASGIPDGSALDYSLLPMELVDTKPKPRQPVKRRKRAPKFVWRKRDAQDSRFYNLQLDINDVKQKIQELTQYREMLLARGLAARQTQPAACVRTVHEYMRVFRHGLHPAPREVDVPAFLRAIMAEDVWINDFRGSIDLILSQWAVYAACFARIDLRCVDVIVLPIEDAGGREGVVVRVLGNYTALVTPNTMAIMFPHVLRAPRLVAQLLDRELHGCSHYDFVFDCQSHRILRCDVNVDFFGAFAKLLPDPRDLAMVFTDAKLESDFYLGEGDVKPVEGPLADEKPFKDAPANPNAATLSPNATRSAETAASSKMALNHILS